MKKNRVMTRGAMVAAGCFIGWSSFANGNANQTVELNYVNLADGTVVSAHPVQQQTLSTVPVDDANPTVFIDVENVINANLRGIGGAFNEMGGEAFARLPKDKQKELAEALFNPSTGSGFSICRTAVGSSDFGLSEYSYSETPDDYKMKHFSIERDVPSVLAFINAAQDENKALRIFASPWSPPGWMKETGSMDGGDKNKETNKLKDDPKIYKAYALYFTKYIQGYAKHGVTVERLIIQNEPDMNPSYPGCDMRPEEMAELTFDYIQPAMEKAGLKTELWAGSFRGKRKDAETFMSLDGAEQIDGVGLQYCSSKTLKTLRTEHADTKLMHTEGKCNNGDNSMAQARKRLGEISMYINGGCENYCYWNIVLNETSTSAWGWKQNSLIKIDRDAGTVTYNADFAPIALLSQNIRPGDQSLSVTSPKGVHAIAVKNSKQVVVFLQNDAEQPVTRNIELSSGEKCAVELPAQALCAVILDPLNEDTSLIPPLPRLQMDIGEGSPDLQWWRDAQATKEDRLGGWRDARFGCFIHWGASAVLGSSWNGKAYGGYGEHIQRMAKIPCEEYREKVVGRFNPTQFDADEWARTIKAAGMRYVIITAKHHDGFAMFDSDASDYNVVDATPFGRDPMAELKAACDKYGLKFGFYYSHAFDWGEPNGSGNDWDYENPGGDRHLFAEKNTKWFDVHPEIAPRIRTYVDEKSIPQVVELVKQYDPDFLWFDTPHKLPPEENLRILKAARMAKPSIVINSRVVSGYEGMPAPGHFGDYASTGDRAVDFPKKEGDWEAIPTTNESYGYNANDHSHKTPEFLVRVLVKAAARGGNMLMNIGPKGDGEIDSVDLTILAGIGTWMDVNEDSIRGTVRTTLPVQAWGESTRKGNRLYLHVFDWPRDGQLDVGGFKGTIQKAWLLSDSKQTALTHQRMDGKTVQVTVPRSAPDSNVSVVVLDVDDADNTSAQRLLSAKQPNMLRAFDAIAEGGEFKYGNGKALDNGVSGWKSESQKISWPVYLLEAGTYTVEAEYSLKGSAPVNPYCVKVGDKTLTATTKGEGAHRNVIFVKHELGRIEIPKGSTVIEIFSEGTPKDDLMKLRALRFTPVEKKDGFAHEPSTAEAVEAAHLSDRANGFDISSFSPERQAWEKLLDLYLEDFYYTRYLSAKKEGKESSWDYVQDVPGLPQVLIIGDSISRGYTLPLRHELEGKANVHRAPQNCSSTVVGMDKLDIWLGDSTWDLITFNFGIHDRRDSSADYETRLRQIVGRLKQTDAKLVWVTTTPIPEGEKEYVEGAIERLNQVAEKIMMEQKVPVLDLYQAISPNLAQYQRPRNCHFKESGYDFMGALMAERIMAEL